MPECVFIGTIHTPYKKIEDCPRNITPGGPVSTLEVNDRYAEALMGIERHEYIQVLYWLGKGNRDTLVQKGRKDGKVAGVFALRSPNRPNPIGSAVVRLIEVSDNKVMVEGMDCLDGTPLIDIKSAIIMEIGDGREIR